MKKTRLFLTVFFILVLSVACAASAQEDRRLTGSDWPRMESQMKSATILVAAKKLQALGVPLERLPEQYVDAIDWMILYHTDSAQRAIGDLLADFLYENEPAARPALDRLLSHESS